MSLTRTQVEGIAHLARLEITEAQMPVYVESLSRIIDFVEQLSAADLQAEVAQAEIGRIHSGRDQAAAGSDVPGLPGARP